MLTDIDEKIVMTSAEESVIKTNRESLALKNVLRSCASVKIFFYSLIWLLILLVVGTITQKEIGLFASQERYFSSMFIWAGVIPLPGARLILTIMFFNLLSKLAFASPWHIKRSGIMISHFGALLLLGGGVLSAYFSVEGSMYLPEGTTSSVFEEYHARELVFIDKSSAEFDKVYSYSGNYLKPETRFSNKKFKGDFEIKASYRNCKFFKRAASNDSNYKGLALNYQIESVQPNVEDTQNRYGLILEIKNSDDQTNGIYFICEWMEDVQSIEIGETEYDVVLRKRQHQLPFAIQLKDFRKIDYQGTQKAKSFESDVIVINSDKKNASEAKTQALVKMNQPLIRGMFTFYQSSFATNDSGEVSVLAVVKNYGRSVPYISSIIICIGLMLHLGLKLPELTRNKIAKRKANDE